MSTPLTDAQLVEHLHARGWPVALSDAPMLREAAAALAGEPSDANMFWNDADPERCRYSIHEILDDEWGDGILQVGETRVIQRAIRLANITVLIVSDPDDEDSFDYEILDDAAVVALRTKEAT